MNHYTFLLALTAPLFFGCKSDSTEEHEGMMRPLACVSWEKELLLEHKNDKCGEWGGDTEQILIFRIGGLTKGELLANYTKAITQCYDPYGEKQCVTKDSIPLNDEEVKLAEECIIELARLKAEEYSSIGHSGVRNIVLLSDSSIFIKNYPSLEWKKFDLLKQSLLKK